MVGRYGAYLSKTTTTFTINHICRDKPLDTVLLDLHMHIPFYIRLHITHIA